MLKNGDMEGLRWIYENFSKRILNQGYRILLSSEQAEDMMQDLFLKLPQTIQDFRGESGLGTWLFRVAHNMCITRLQSAKNHSHLENENIETLSPSSNAVHYEDTDILNKALAVLDAETRSLLWLKDGEGIPLNELAITFKAPEGTLKSKLSRARARIKEVMEKDLGYVRV